MRPCDQAATWTPLVIPNQPIRLLGKPLERGQRKSLSYLPAAAPLTMQTLGNHICGKLDALA
jgi:hypothetical protein